MVQPIPVPPDYERQHPGDGRIVVGKRQPFREDLLQPRPWIPHGLRHEQWRSGGGQPTPDPLAVGVGRRRRFGRILLEKPSDQARLPVQPSVGADLGEVGTDSDWCWAVVAGRRERGAYSKNGTSFTAYLRRASSSISTPMPGTSRRGMCPSAVSIGPSKVTISWNILSVWK